MTLSAGPSSLRKMPRWAKIMIVLTGAAIPFSFILVRLPVEALIGLNPPALPPPQVQYLLTDGQSCERLIYYQGSRAYGNYPSWDSVNNKCTLGGPLLDYYENLVIGRGITLDLNYSGRFGSVLDQYGETQIYVKVVNNGTIVINEGREILFSGSLIDRGTVSLENGTTFVNTEGGIIRGGGNIIVDGGQFENKGSVERVKIIGPN